MLSERELRAWEEIERAYAAEFREVPTGTGGWDLADLPPLVVAGVWIAVLLVLFGAVALGLGLVAALAVASWARRRGGRRRDPRDLGSRGSA